MRLPASSPDDIRALLCAFQDEVRASLLRARAAEPAAATTHWRAVAGKTQADTMYGIDHVADVWLVDWFEAHWPHDDPVELVTEGLDNAVVVPEGTAVDDAAWTCIIDSIDGTRGLMYDKRAAWSLAAVAPRRRTRPRLTDVVVAAMTELPTTKQWASDQISGVRGCGRDGLVYERVDVRGGARTPQRAVPSEAVDFEHGFASFARFLPAAKGVTAAFEERLWRALYGEARVGELMIFEDQYLATGGQFHELLAGHDRMLGDLRPIAWREAGIVSSLACHPYDCCTAMLLEEAGCVVMSPWGSPLDVPLDTTTPVAWIGFANAALAERVWPALSTALAATFPTSFPEAPDGCPLH